MPMSGGEKVAVVVSLSVPIVAAIILLFDRPRPSPATIDLRTADDAAAPLAPVAGRR